MIKRLRNALRQLRWKLTLSYTAVAVGTLLIMLLVLALLVFSTVLIPGDVVTPDIWVNATNDQLVPIVRGFLAASPPDLAQIKTILEAVDQLGGIIAGNDLLEIGQVELTVQSTADIDLAVVSPDGSLLATSNRAISSSLTRPQMALLLRRAWQLAGCALSIPD